MSSTASRRSAQRAGGIDLHAPVDGQLDLDLFAAEPEPSVPTPRTDPEPEPDPERSV